jgi:hypothetical protein
VDVNNGKQCTDLVFGEENKRERIFLFDFQARRHGAHLRSNPWINRRHGASSEKSMIDHDYQKKARSN